MASFLPALEESLEKCNESNLKYVHLLLSTLKCVCMRLVLEDAAAIGEFSLSKFGKSEIGKMVSLGVTDGKGQNHSMFHRLTQLALGQGH